MEINEIKQQLTLAEVLKYYGLKPDKSLRLHCPFHEDKTPSLQIYYKTHTAYCFSSNCKTHGKSLDVIDFIMHKENTTKHEAIKQAETLIGGSDQQAISKEAFLSNMFTYFKNAVHNSKPTQEYIKSRNLDFSKQEIGYNAGQFHHGTRKDETLINQCLRYGLLIDAGLTAKTGDKAYKVFGKGCIVFALKNRQHQVSGLYFRSTTNNDTAKHYYLKDRQGIYPGYPKAETQKLIITEAVIDAATLINIPAITESYSIVTAYGTNGLNQEIKTAIQELPQLQEIIFAFDADEAGQAAVSKYTAELHELLPGVIITTLTLPLKDINETAQAHDDDAVFIQLLAERKPFFLSTEPNTPTEKETLPKPQPDEAVPPMGGRLTGLNPEQLVYETAELIITIWGGIEQENLSRLKVSLHIRLKSNKYRSFRDDVNLYSYAGTQKLTTSIAETLELGTGLIGATITDLTETLEKYRSEERAQQLKALVPQAYQMTAQEKQAAEAFLKEPDLVQRTLDTLSRTGLIGEQKNGLLLYFLYLSRFFEEPLHAIIFGKSGSGKTYLQTRISECLPEESVRTTTSLSENTLYYSPKNFWKHIVLLIEDLDGVYNALLPLREFMSKQSITKLTTDKDAKGNNVQKVLTVEGPICVSGATTKENIYEDNANRSFLIYVDEGASHLNEVMEYQRKQQAGLINKAAQEKAKQELRNVQRLLVKDIQVINPYALHLRIPDNVFKKLRTNMHYLKLIEIITFYHQQQRPIKKGTDGTRYIETTPEDIYWANELVKEVLLKKSDELNGELRGFFEQLKNHVKAANKDPNATFFAKDIRKTYRMHPMQLTRHLIQLERRGYIKQVSSNRKTGFEYQVTEWEEYSQLQEGVNIMDTILAKLKPAKNKAVIPQLHAYSQNGV
ncbi:MAG: CHC2 zinc finger domain-containing protein [Bacteroidota bacterium]